MLRHERGQVLRGRGPGRNRPRRRQQVDQLCLVLAYLRCQQITQRRVVFDGQVPAIDGNKEAPVGQVLELVGLANRADRAVKGFSGGERQRLGIGQALINSPELLILDEPAAALDPMGRRDVLDVMRGLREETTIFYSTHILDDVQRVSDTVYADVWPSVGEEDLPCFRALERRLVTDPSTVGIWSPPPSCSMP